MEYTLKEWRNQKGISQTELAEAIGRTQVTISHWETGTSDLKFKDMQKLRTALGLEPTDVILMETD